MHPSTCIYIYFAMDDRTPPPLPCMCASLRRAARALTQLYEKELRPLGLRSTQLTILQVLSRTGELTQKKLGEILSMDSTSLTRTVAVMLREGWLTERRGEDRRERWIGMARAGEKKLSNALPAWEKVQKRLRQEIGPQSWKDLMQLTRQLTQFAATTGDSL
ncbi:MAG TPA: MarR family winged helix-turn-helix transcriptional regulator [Terracidiphilus sp.]